MVALIFLSIAIAFLTHSLSIRHFFTQDTLYLPTFFRDIFWEGGNFFDWYLPGAPYFFPDMALFFPIKAIFRDTYFSALIYALLQTATTYFLVLWLIKVLPRSDESKSRGDIFQDRSNLFLMIFLLVISCLAIQNNSNIEAIDIAHSPYFRILTSVFHFGNIMNMLVAAVMTILLLDQRMSSWGYVVLFFVSVFATGSDALFIVGFTVPSTLAVIFAGFACKLDRKIGLRIIFVSFLGVAIGILLKAALTADTTLSYILRENDLSGQLKALYSVTLISFKDMPIVMVLIFAFYEMLLWKIYRDLRVRTQATSHLYLYSFILLSVLLTIAALVINGVIEPHYRVSRYFLNLYWFPVLFSWLIVDVFPHPRPFRSKYARNAVFIMTLFFAGYSAFPRGQFYSKYIPPVVQCVDQGLKTYTDTMGLSVKYGISPYWPAIALNEFSKFDLKIVQVKPDLSPSFWVNNITRYRSRYDFAITESLSNNHEVPDSSIVSRINGAPKDEFSCEDAHPRTRVLIYGENELRTEVFSVSGDSYTWQACELPTKNGNTIKENCSVTTENTVSPGIVTFGPYVSVPSGRYHFNIQYSSTSAFAEAIGSWDVVVASSEKSEQIQKGTLNGSKGEASKISDSFNVSEEYNNGRVEVRTVNNGSSELTIFNLTITKVD